MKILTFLFAFIIATNLLNAQINYKTNDDRKFIEVTGSAELEVEPDEIHLIIGIEEYWKEEFNKKTKFEDYKTKVPINEIENKLISDLTLIGIPKENITIQEVGNYWRYNGKEFLFKKQLDIKLSDFKKVDQIIKIINAKGIEFMSLGELTNKNLTGYRKQVKIEALKAAKNKAEYLLECLDKKVGEVISIEEVNSSNFSWNPQSLLCNSVMNSPQDSGNDNIRKIKLRFEIKAKFEIK